MLVHSLSVSVVFQVVLLSRTENLEIPGGKIPCKKLSKISVYLARLSFFPSNPDCRSNKCNKCSITETTENFLKFKPEFLVEWKAPLFYCFPFYLSCTLLAKIFGRF